MRHLFGKEHKEQKSIKLLKKLQLEEDQKWQEELQRRLEQEEKDAAFARELQEQMSAEESTTTPTTITTTNSTTTNISPVSSPIAMTSSSLSSPPPLPVKPIAYHSEPSSSTSSNSSNIDHRSRPQVGSSSSTAQRDVPPPPYQNGQPKLPPRERTVSQVSQYIPSTPNFSSNTSTAASAPPQPTTSRVTQQECYRPALNTAVTPGIGHQVLNPQPYYPGTPQPQSQVYPVSTPQIPPTTPMPPTTYVDQHHPRRDPAMLIIPPRKEKQPSHNYSPVTTTVSSTIPMPEPTRTNSPFYYSTTYSSSSSSSNLTSTPMNTTSRPSSSSTSVAAAAAATTTTTTTAIIEPQRIHTPAPINNFHSLPTTNAISSHTMTNSAIHVSPKITNSLPVTNSYLIQSGLKPDQKMENHKEESDNRKMPSNMILPTKTLEGTNNDNVDDDDEEEENGSLVWERNDGRMMSSTPSTKSATVTTTTTAMLHTNEKTASTFDGIDHHEKHIVTNETNEDYDSGSGSDGEEEDDDGHDDAIDPFDINADDNVIIHQYTKSTPTPQFYAQNNNDDNVDPFADTFAVDSNKSEYLLHERSKSAGVIDVKPMFQMNNKTSTIAKVHDPLLMRATGATSSSQPTRPASTLPWTSTSFASSSITLSTTTPSIGSTIPRPASVYQHPLHQQKNDDEDDLITLDSDDIQPVIPTNVLRAGAPPNLQSMINQVTAEGKGGKRKKKKEKVIIYYSLLTPFFFFLYSVPSNEFGYYHYQTDKPGGEKEEIEEIIVKALPKLPKCKYKRNWNSFIIHFFFFLLTLLLIANPDHRHITVPSVIENQRVWIRVHPTDTGKALASRIHIVATYKTRKILSITTDKGRNIPLDETPVFTDWAGVMEMEDGAPWKVEWTVMDHNLWEGPKEFLRYLKTSLRS
ncbi:uncharacterized protein BX664DRAFT_343600 [Halteromyces radiatus]|uniref:uncharacterized protein n=1 Tax=Halteromyces radiatus TaxID=101107 RepID=UPI00221F092A|nr:uncharacterized protein BX664DRAFT_343600 [Halteromyces radiatus]KAI8077835.1 hypothetical protein BX664DRAFT_343600 [Halteromyces radiatus]